jgi:predicted AlkP superfamily pyrophosphatase or phosphodiesterase
MLVQLGRLLESTAGERLYVSAYWSTVDSLSHDHGWNDEIVAAELQTIITQIQTHFLANLSKRARRKTVFLLFADHGQALTPAVKALYLEDHPRLQEMLLMKPTGEARVPYLYTRHGQLQTALEYLNSQLGHALVAWPSAQVLSQGLLGPPPFAARAADRIGDIVVVMRDGYAFLNTRAADQERVLRWNGRHGGLTLAEMLVPWLAFRLDAH